MFFRKYTVAEAQRLGLVGYVRNTERGTVEGEAQGPPKELAAFKVQCKFIWIHLGFILHLEAASAIVRRMQLTLGHLQDFLMTRGSPQSRIDRCNFTHEFSEERRDYDGFCQK